MKIKSSVILLSLLTFLSCRSQTHSPPFYDPDSSASDSLPVARQAAQQPLTNSNDDLIVVSYKDIDGLKHINANYNGKDIDMVFSTECSGSLISSAEAKYLYQKGDITKSDLVGISSQSDTTAIMENMVIQLKRVVIDGKLTCKNVYATVSENAEAPLIICNDAINQFGTYTLDDDKKTICFKLK